MLEGDVPFVPKIESKEGQEGRAGNGWEELLWNSKT